MTFYPFLTAGLLAFALQLTTCFSGQAQPGPERVPPVLWQATTRSVPDTTRPTAFARVDLPALTALLQTAPPEAQAATGVLLTVPLPDGTTELFRVWQVPVLYPTVAARYPSIQTYAGQGVRNPALTARFDLTPQGFHGYVLGAAGGPVVVNPEVGEPNVYRSTGSGDEQPGSPWRCFTATPPQPGRTGNPVARTQTAAFGGTLLTYRLALACTGEYAVAVAGPMPTTTAVLAAMVTTLNRVTGIYEREVGIRLQLVGSSAIIYLNGATDPYTNNDPNALLSENQTNLNLVVGAANYDIGHVFSTGGGGIAALRSVCEAGVKAQGVTGLPNPVGDAFDVDYVAHEIGHQFGAEHTFNSTSGACGGNRSAVAAVEPGSGSTIMSYAGICAPDNLQRNSDPYFHAYSQDQIRGYVLDTGAGAGGSCPVAILTGNQPPVVDAGPDFLIPRGTPFTLTGSATDANNDALTYSWEQLDPDNTAMGGSPGAADTSSTAPLFRSFAPVAGSSRTFPRLSDILANTRTIGEILPDVTRTLTFRLTARDNRANGGGVASDETNVIVLNTATPFRISNANTALSQPPASTFTLTWDVAGTHLSPIRATTVDIRFSVDGGFTFPYVLAAATPNDGTETITFPGVVTNLGRLQVLARGNVFFDINDAPISLAGPLPVSLVGFEATAQGPDAWLTWTTAQELRNAGFEVQAQGPGELAFRTVAFVQGRGTSSQGQRYQHTLPGLAPGLWQVRLRQLDEGTAAQPGTYSPIRSVRIGPAVATASVWPNPVLNGVARISVYLPEAGPVQFTLHDMLGRRVLKLAPTLQPAGRSEWPVALPPLPAGLYVWQLTAPGPHPLQGKLEVK